MVTPRQTISRHRNIAGNYVAIPCDWLARFLPEMSEISFDRLLERSRFLKRDPAVVHWTPKAHPYGLGLPILNYCSAETLRLRSDA